MNYHLVLDWLWATLSTATSVPFTIDETIDDTLVELPSGMADLLVKRKLSLWSTRVKSYDYAINNSFLI